MKPILILAILAVSATVGADYTEPKTHYYFQDYSKSNSDEFHDSVREPHYRNHVSQRPYVNDREISSNINAYLKKGSNAKKFDLVAFEVRSGNVYLQGSVSSIAEKNKIEKAVREISGVKIIQNNLSIKTENVSTKDPNSLYRQIAAQEFTGKIRPPVEESPDLFETEADRQLNVKIRNALESSPVADRVLFVILETNNGIVKLKGKVKNMDDVREVLVEVKKVNGVKSVSNQLTAETR